MISSELDMNVLTLVLHRLLSGLLFFLLLVVPAFAVDKVDTAFGEKGFSINDFGFGDDEALALAVQPDGKYIVAGYSNNGAVANMTVARYLLDGSLDISFNYDGVFFHSVGVGDTVARSITVQNDGRILVAASSDVDNPSLVIVALTPDGYLDAAFGDNGQVSFEVDGDRVFTADLKVATDGTVVVGATVVTSDSSRNILFVKVDSNGDTIEGFGDDGIVYQEQAVNSEMRSLALLNGGKILVAGAVEIDGEMRAGLFRRNADGTPDRSFGKEGQLSLVLDGESSIINDIWVGSEENILFAGAVKENNKRRAFAFRLGTDGAVDAEFAGGQGVFYSTIGNDNVANAITVQQDGTIVLAGFGSSEQGRDVIVWSLSGQDEETEPVSKFVATPLITDMGSDNDVCNAIIALPTGQVLAAGSGGTGADKDFALVRYTTGVENISQQVGNTSNGVVTGRYTVTTSLVTDITRVGAVTGGFISDNYHGLSCETSCNGRCKKEDGTIDATCYEKCFKTCAATSTVELRGVCYNVIGNPVYNEKSTDDGDNTAQAGDIERQGIFPKESSDKSFIYDIVRVGQTEDGSGLGAFMSDVEEITPDVTYYLRAYAVMPDGSVIYGNEVTFKTDDACFIATAAYGSFLDTHVTLLREFRDTYLMHSGVGRRFVSTYYHYSPAVADFIRENELLRGIMRILLCPFVAFALLLLRTTFVVKCVGVAVCGAIAAYYCGMYWNLQRR